MMMIPKRVKPRRMKEAVWKQPKYILFLKEQFPYCEIHHLIHHNKMPNRRRRDDRLVWPLLPNQHKALHDVVGDELKYMKSIGVSDPYEVSGMAWELWVIGGPDNGILISDFFKDRTQ